MSRAMLFSARKTNDENVEKGIHDLQVSLMQPGEIGNWLANDSNAFGVFANRRLADFFNYDFDGKAVRSRLVAYNKHVANDKDRVRHHGQYYNNIYLGKRIFGPARKQVFSHTIVGGMERRFEIIDNQVNYIPFTHEVSDKCANKCRNPRIKCRDDTRVVLRFPEEKETLEKTFIHANYVKSPLLFNDFILTQAPMQNTIGDFWRLIWQEEAPYIFMLNSRKEPDRCAQYWPKSSRDPFFRITRLRIIGPNNKEHRVEHWQADMNNSENVEAPLRLLRLARSCSKPTVVHDHLGISRAACLIAAELAITKLLRELSHKQTVQKSVHYLRSLRPFSIETPMQYLFVHRVVQHFIRPLVGIPKGFEADYARWLDERSQRLFVDDFQNKIPAFRLLSPKVDPDLLPLVRHQERPNTRRELHAHVGELPLPADYFESSEDHVLAAGDMKLKPENTRLPKKYPRGRRY
ncbi:protein-tyrosine phosphatase domain-containing protein [Ditylenchus destructor]|uniref:Protein-tyrosine phosphatase domain-containing protein n=1 Tax=Ditylenchus destructor TaxID=166010 RepID=A0AAD4N9I7_9BILA|nr:protein-tyrosine phosphatase domain-containing protein [Ditylenchus destructor]